ncbi:hypothetical protein [Vreelandella utahensis]|uniref:hypothetical protein n=1 Tax=Vreelandella halophila TaxID=86177 RepID=UPI000987A0E6|nr:hypothetical protein [Halomonas utahensis]
MLNGYLQTQRVGKSSMMALVLTAGLSVGGPAISAERELHTGFGKTIYHDGCGEALRLAEVLRKTARGMEEMQKNQGLRVDHEPIRDYLRDNLELDSTPEGSAEHTLFSGIIKLILEGEGRETVNDKTMELCKREFGS